MPGLALEQRREALLLPTPGDFVHFFCLASFFSSFSPSLYPSIFLFFVMIPLRTSHHLLLFSKYARVLLVSFVFRLISEFLFVF